MELYNCPNMAVVTIFAPFLTDSQSDKCVGKRFNFLLVE